MGCSLSRTLWKQNSCPLDGRQVTFIDSFRTWKRVGIGGCIRLRHGNCTSMQGSPAGDPRRPKGHGRAYDWRPTRGAKRCSQLTSLPPALRLNTWACPLAICTELRSGQDCRDASNLCYSYTIIAVPSTRLQVPDVLVARASLSWKQCCLGRMTKPRWWLLVTQGHVVH